MLLEIAIGDAYGAGFEFVGKDFIDTHNKLRYVTHPNVSSFNVDQRRLGSWQKIFEYENGNGERK